MYVVTDSRDGFKQTYSERQNAVTEFLARISPDFRGMYKRRIREDLDQIGFSRAGIGHELYIKRL